MPVDEIRAQIEDVVCSPALKRELIAHRQSSQVTKRKLCEADLHM